MQSDLLQGKHYLIYFGFALLLLFVMLNMIYEWAMRTFD